VPKGVSGISGGGLCSGVFGVGIGGFCGGGVPGGVGGGLDGPAEGAHLEAPKIWSTCRFNSELLTLTK